MTEADLKKWARMLREAADALDKAEPNGVMYTAARMQVALVFDQMYVAHQQAARDAWDQVLGRRAVRHKGDPLYNEPPSFYEL